MKKITAFLIAFIATFSIFATSLPTQARFTPPFEVNSEAAIVVDIESGDVIYEKNSESKVSPGVLVQIVTAAVSLQQAADPSAVEVTAIPSVFDDIYGGALYTADIRRGETMSLEDFLYAMMIQSSFEAAHSIAYHFGDGDPQVFVDMLNNFAIEADALSTRFANSYGGNSEEAVTTVSDMVKIIKAAFEVSGFSDLAYSTSYTLPATSYTGERLMIPNNTLLRKNNADFIDGAMGIKAGTTGDSGRTFATVVTIDNIDYLIIATGGDVYDDSGALLAENTAAEDINALVDWIDDSFTLSAVATKGDVLAEISVVGSDERDIVLLAASQDFITLIPDEGDESSVLKVYNLPEYIEAPVEVGDEIGSVSFMLAGEEIGRVSLISSEAVAYSPVTGLFDFIDSILSSPYFWIIIGILLLAVLLYLYATLKNNKGKVKRANTRRRIK